MKRKQENSVSLSSLSKGIQKRRIIEKNFEHKSDTGAIKFYTKISKGYINQYTIHKIYGYEIIKSRWLKFRTEFKSINSQEQRDCRQKVTDVFSHSLNNLDPTIFLSVLYTL